MAQEYMAKTANGLTQLCLPVRDPNAGEKLRTLQQNLRVRMGRTDLKRKWWC